MFLMNKEEIQDLEQKIQLVLFSGMEEDSKKCMCAVIPSNGIYIAGKVTREFNQCEQPVVDMYPYFRNMKLGDYHDLAAALDILEAGTKRK